MVGGDIYTAERTKNKTSKIATTTRDMEVQFLSAMSTLNQATDHEWRLKYGSPDRLDLTILGLLACKNVNQLLPCWEFAEDRFVKILRPTEKYLLASELEVPPINCALSCTTRSTRDRVTQNILELGSDGVGWGIMFADVGVLEWAFELERLLHRECGKLRQAKVAIFIHCSSPDVAEMLTFLEGPTAFSHVSFGILVDDEFAWSSDRPIVAKAGKFTEEMWLDLLGRRMLPDMNWDLFTRVGQSPERLLGIKQLTGSPYMVNNVALQSYDLPNRGSVVGLNLCNEVLAAVSPGTVCQCMLMGISFPRYQRLSTDDRAKFVDVLLTGMDRQVTLALAKYKNILDQSWRGIGVYFTGWQNVGRPVSSREIVSEYRHLEKLCRDHKLYPTFPTLFCIPPGGNITRNYLESPPGIERLEYVCVLYSGKMLQLRLPNYNSVEFFHMYQLYDIPKFMSISNHDKVSALPSTENKIIGLSYYHVPVTRSSVSSALECVACSE